MPGQTRAGRLFSNRAGAGLESGLAQVFADRDKVRDEESQTLALGDLGLGRNDLRSGGRAAVGPAGDRPSEQPLGAAAAVLLGGAEAIGSAGAAVVLHEHGYLRSIRSGAEPAEA